LAELSRAGEPIPFNRPFVSGRELEYLAEAIEARELAGGGEDGVLSRVPAQIGVA
jgi:hypothetical protein